MEKVQSELDKVNRQLSVTAGELKTSLAVCEQLRLDATQQEAVFNSHLDELQTEHSENTDDCIQDEGLSDLRKESLAMHGALEKHQDRNIEHHGSSAGGDFASAKEQARLLASAREALLYERRNVQELQSTLESVSINHVAAAKIQSKYKDHRHQSQRRRMLQAVRRQKCRHGNAVNELASQVEGLSAQLEARIAELQSARAASEESERRAEALEKVDETARNQNDNSAWEAQRLAESEHQRQRLVWEQKVRDAQELVREAELRVQCIEERVIENCSRAQLNAVKIAVDAALTDAKAREDERISQLRADFAAQTQHQLSIRNRAEELEKELAGAMEQIRCVQSERHLAKQELANAAARADKAEREVASAKIELAAAAQVKGVDSRIVRGGLHPNVEGTPNTNHQDSMRWETLLRENTELRVAKMRAESELERCQEQLQFNNSLYEELQNEASNKDELVASLQEKLSDLRRRSRQHGAGGSQTSSPDRFFGQESSASSVPSSRVNGDDAGTRSVASSRTGMVPAPPRCLSHEHLTNRAATETPKVARNRAAYVEYGPSKETKIHELESSVEELVSRLQMLSSSNSSSTRNASRRSRRSRSALDELRSQLRGQREGLHAERSWSSDGGN